MNKQMTSSYKFDPEDIHYKDVKKYGYQRRQINVNRTEGVKDSEYKSVISSLQRVAEEIGKTLTVVDASNGGSDVWIPGQAQQLQNVNSFKRSEKHTQVDSTGLLQSIIMKSYKGVPSYECMIVDQDIGSKDGNFNYSYGSSSYPTIVYSVNRFINIEQKDIDFAMKMGVAHEFLHLINLVQRNNGNLRKRGVTNKMIYNHCGGQYGPCIMEQVDVAGLKRVEEQIKIMRNRRDWICDRCKQEIVERRNAFVGQGLFW